jgi:hypothetical protein
MPTDINTSNGVPEAPTWHHLSAFPQAIPGGKSLKQ